jgi:hypothetical protein
VQVGALLIEGFTTEHAENAEIYFLITDYKITLEISAFAWG